MNQEHKLKWKENEKLDKNQELVRELKKLCNMKVSVVQIIVKFLRTTITKKLEILLWAIRMIGVAEN